MPYEKRIAAVELRHLRYFVVTAEEGVVTRAAERLGIQQPPLSQQLRALESEIGTPLFRRSTRGVQLTEAGRSLLDGARQILQLVDETLEATRRVGSGEQGALKVGYTSSTAFNRFLPETVRVFKERYTDISLQLEESCTAELVEALRSGQLDVAFIRGRMIGTSTLAIEPLLEEEMVVAVPAGHPIASKATPQGIALGALARETFVLYRRMAGPGLYDTIIATCARAGFSPVIGQEAPRMIGALNLVAAGLGITLVPASMQRLDTEAVSYHRLRGSLRVMAPVQIAFSANDLCAAGRLFVDHVTESARQRAESRGSQARPAHCDEAAH